NIAKYSSAITVEPIMNNTNIVGLDSKINFIRESHIEFVDILIYFIDRLLSVIQQSSRDLFIGPYNTDLYYANVGLILAYAEAFDEALNIMIDEYQTNEFV